MQKSASNLRAPPLDPRVHGVQSLKDLGVSRPDEVLSTFFFYFSKLDNKSADSVVGIPVVANPISHNALFRPEVVQTFMGQCVIAVE